MMFYHDGKIITIDQLTYYEKATLSTLGGVLPLVSSSHKLITTYTVLNPSYFKPSMLLGTFTRDPFMIEEISPNIGALVCMMASSNYTQAQEPIIDTMHSMTIDSMSLPHTIM